MQKKAVPFLVMLMTFSLLGIILVQYRWIKNTLNEKENLIDNQVNVVLSNVETKLGDLKGIELISNRIDVGPLLRTIDSMHYSNSYIYSTEGDSLTTLRMEVLEGSSHTLNINLDDERLEIKDCLNVAIDHDLHQIIKLIKKVDIEKSGNQNDIRFDSLNLFKVLKKEFSALDDTGNINWGLFDNLNHSYKIVPFDKNGISHQKNLFSTDFISPNRYQLQIGIDTNKMVWQEIKLMIALSIVFLSIIVFVFAFSIRLLLKHKKISEIKSNFINNMTHEFKTPLSSISLAADTMIHPGTEINESVLKYYVNIIQTERKKLNHHVERILEVGALKKDTFEVALSSVVLNDVVSSAIEELALIIAQCKANIIVESIPKIVVQANQGHLKNTFINIIENAIKYSKGEPYITIHFLRYSDTVSVKVTDHGIGMLTSEVKHIFNDFYRVQSGNIHQTKGFGLGLSYCRLVIEKMGGSIAVKSKIDIGTEVEIKLTIL